MISAQRNQSAFADFFVHDGISDRILLDEDNKRLVFDQINDRSVQATFVINKPWALDNGYRFDPTKDRVYVTLIYKTFTRTLRHAVRTADKWLLSTRNGAFPVYAPSDDIRPRPPSTTTTTTISTTTIIEDPEIPEPSTPEPDPDPPTPNPDPPTPAPEPPTPEPNPPTPDPPSPDPTTPEQDPPTPDLNPPVTDLPNPDPTTTDLDTSTSDTTPQNMTITPKASITTLAPQKSTPQETVPNVATTSKSDRDKYISLIVLLVVSGLLLLAAAVLGGLAHQMVPPQPLVE